MIKEEINKFFGGIFMKMSKVLTTVLTATAALVLQLVPSLKNSKWR